MIHSRLWCGLTYIRAITAETHPFRCVLPPYLHMRPYTSSYSHWPHMSEQVPIWPSPITHLTSPHLTSPHLTSPHLTSPNCTQEIHLHSQHNYVWAMPPHDTLFITSPLLASPHFISHTKFTIWCMVVHGATNGAQQNLAEHARNGSTLTVNRQPRTVRISAF